MKIEKAILKELVSTASANVARTQNIFSCVRIIHKGNEINIQAMDTLSVEAFAEVAEAGDEFDIFVSGVSLSKAVSHFNKDVEMKVDGDVLILSEGAFVQRLKLMTAENSDSWKFPQEPLQIFEMHDTARKFLFNKIDAIANPKMEGTMRGTCKFSSNGSEITTNSMDGSMLSNRKYSLELPEFELMLPTQITRLIATNSGACKFGFMKNSGGVYLAMFKFEHVKYFTRVYNIEYPDISKLLNMPRANSFKIDALTLKNEVAKFGDYTRAIISWDNCEVSFSATSELGAMDDVLSVEETYEAGEIKINPQLLAKVIANMADDVEVMVSFCGSGIPTLNVETQGNIAKVAGLIG